MVVLCLAPMIFDFRNSALEYLMTTYPPLLVIECPLTERVAKYLIHFLTPIFVVHSQIALWFELVRLIGPWWTLSLLSMICLRVLERRMLYSCWRSIWPLSHLWGGFIYILDNSNSSSIKFWTRSNWTGVWTGNSNGSWTDKQSSHFNTAIEVSVKATFFFM